MGHCARLALLLLALGLAGCTGLAPDPDAAKSRRFEVAQYFVGRIKAWGVVEPRFGGQVRQFTVDLDGRRDGEDIVVDEYFLFSDGERQERHWRIRRTPDGRLEGEASGVPGGAVGGEDGASLTWSYDLVLDLKGGSWRIAFRNWMFRIDDEVVLNRAFLSKWGIPVGEVTIAFRKLS